MGLPLAADAPPCRGIPSGPVSAGQRVVEQTCALPREVPHRPARTPSPQHSGRDACRSRDQRRNPARVYCRVVGNMSHVGSQAPPRPRQISQARRRLGDGSTDVTSALDTPRLAPGATTDQAPPRALRLRLKPKAPTTGWVDGGWWPRSRDLAAELLDLLA